METENRPDKLPLFEKAYKEKRPLNAVPQPRFRFGTFIEPSLDSLDTLRTEQDFADSEIEKNWWILTVISFVVILFILILH